MPHYHQGQLVGTSRKYDERLTVALLSMRGRMGEPKVGRYGAAAEFRSEKWDDLLQRVEVGALDWQEDDEDDPYAAADREERRGSALIRKHAHDEPLTRHERAGDAPPPCRCLRQPAAFRELRG